jgi:hypothetical protein
LARFAIVSTVDCVPLVRSGVAAEASACHDGGMRPAPGWRRPYAHPERWATAAMILVACGTLVTPVLDGEMTRVTAAAFMAIALGLAGRVVHTGLFVGPAGIRIRTMWRTSTYDWLRIDDFDTVRDRHRTGLVLHLVGGSTVPTPIGIERVARTWSERMWWWPDSVGAVRPYLTPRRYEKLVATLRQCLDQARASQCPCIRKDHR